MASPLDAFKNLFGGGPSQAPLTDQRSTGQSVLDLFKRGLGGIAGSQGGLGGFVESQGQGGFDRLGGGGLSRLQQAEINDALSQVNTGDFYEVAPGWKAWRGVSGADILSQKMAARNKGLLSAKTKEEEAKFKKEDRAIKKEAAIEDRAIRAADRALNKRKVRVQERRVKVQELELRRRLLKGILAPTQQQKKKAKDAGTALGKVMLALGTRYGEAVEKTYAGVVQRLVNQNELNKEDFPDDYRDLREPRNMRLLLREALDRMQFDKDTYDELFGPQGVHNQSDEDTPAVEGGDDDDDDDEATPIEIPKKEADDWFDV